MLMLAGLLGLTNLLVGCGPADVPKYEVVDTNETAFVVPLEGDTAKQVKFESADALNAYKVATKRILIPRRESSTGRGPGNFEWIDTVRVIKISRAPVTLQWSSDNKTSGNGIWVESKDSVGFSTGFSVTGMVLEEDTAIFLYKYTGSQLKDVIEREVRARVQGKVAEVSATYNMDELRSKKNEIVTKVTEDIIPFFKARGITITTLGSFGGFTYENPKIQDSIDAVFIAQQEKNIANALLTAQKDKNQRLLEEGQGEASKVKEIAKGKAEAVETEAKAQASAIDMVARATKAAGSDPLFLEVKKLEVATEQIKRWNGQYPQFMMSGSNTPTMLMNMPSPR